MKKPLLLCLLLLLCYSCQETESGSAPEDPSVKLDSLTQDLKREKLTSDSLRNIIHTRDSIAEAYPVFFGRKYEDIENPEEFIRNELRNQPELIPLSPVLGGSMAYRKIEIISEKWVLAIYDDGHIQGKAIFEYQLQPDGNINYTLVATQEG